MKNYEKPYISDEELEFVDICVESGTNGGDGIGVDFPYEGVKNND